jgi:hypothetical protein
VPLFTKRSRAESSRKRSRAPSREEVEEKGDHEDDSDHERGRALDTLQEQGDGRERRRVEAAALHSQHTPELQAVFQLPESPNVCFTVWGNTLEGPLIDAPYPVSAEIHSSSSTATEHFHNARLRWSLPPSAPHPASPLRPAPPPPPPTLADLRRHLLQQRARKRQA